MNPLGLLIVSFALAFLAESMVEYLFGTPFDHVPALQPYKWLLMYISAGVGVGFTFFWSLDIVSLIGSVAGYPLEASWLGFLLTGLAIGRGANYLHQFVSEYFPKPVGN